MNELGDESNSLSVRPLLICSQDLQLASRLRPLCTFDMPALVDRCPPGSLVPDANGQMRLYICGWNANGNTHLAVFYQDSSYDIVWITDAA
jgi:hypothetical protein